MAFETIFEVDTMVATCKATEDVACKIVKIVNDRTGDISHRMEARIKVNDPGRYIGWTKTALAFKSADDVDDLIANLTEMRSQWNALKLTGAPEINAPVVRRRERPAARPARAKAGAR